MIYTIRYTDHDVVPRRLEVDAIHDVFCVSVPAQPEESLPALEVDVNSDALVVSVRGQVRHLVTFQEALEK